MLRFFLNKPISSLFLLLISQSVFSQDNHVYLGGILGASFAEIGKKNPSITYYDGDLNDAYPARHNHQTKTMLGMNAGYEFAGRGYRPAIALGLGVYSTPEKYDMTGQVIETPSGDPSFLLYNYKYTARSTRLMAELQLSWMLKSFLPFINVGIGPAWNQAEGYSETVATLDNYLTAPPFQSQTNTSFAYQAGIGVGYAFNFCSQSSTKKERVSLGYRYVDAGDISFGIRDASYPHQLDLGHFKSNEVYVNYTHLF